MSYIEWISGNLKVSYFPELQGHSGALPLFAASEHTIHYSGSM